MQTIDRDGVRIAYEVTGEGAGVPVLLTHGFSADHHSWSATVAHLGARRRCITWDVRGHGASDSPTDPASYTPALSLADMAAVLDAAAVERAVIGGHSMGGYLSMRFWLAHPDRVAGLLLVDTGPGYRKDEARTQWNDTCEAFARRFEERGRDGLARSPEVGAAQHRGVEGLVLAARGILRQHDAAVIEHLAAIDVPTVVIVGSDDRAYLDGASYMAKKIAGARHHVVEGAGHAPMLTHPSEVDAAVDELLAEVDAAASRTP
jgi:pimeloyl-ACP methyl ester carboxylesterase